MATHTPGPWRVEHRRIGDTLFNEQRVYGPKGSYTATFDSEPLFDWFVEPVRLQVGDEANARLIARAPELLATCNSLAALAYSLMNPAQLPQCYHDAMRIIAEVEGN